MKTGGVIVIFPIRDEIEEANAHFWAASDAAFAAARLSDAADEAKDVAFYLLREAEDAWRKAVKTVEELK